MSTPYPDTGSAYADPDAPPTLVEPETRRLDGVVREASVPPFARPVTYGSLADLPYDNAATAPESVVLSRKGPDGEWTDITAERFAAQVHAVAKGLIAEGLVPG
ncbi:long-chain fatty acid--CoA ligase, partial [Streptomyces sp. NPDC005486]